MADSEDLKPWEKYSGAAQPATATSAGAKPWEKYASQQVPEPAAAATPAQQPNAQPARSPLAQVGRSIGLAARMPLEAAGGTVGMLGDAMNTAINSAAGTHLGMPSSAIQRGIDAITPVPENAGEKIGDFVGSVAAGGLRGGVDPLARAITGRFAGPAASNFENVKGATLRAGQELGLVATPKTAEGSLLQRGTQSLLGSDQIQHAAVTRNQQVYDTVARQVAGLPTDAPLTKETLTKAIGAEHDAGYAPISQAGWLTNGKVYREALDKALNDFQGASRSFPDATKSDVRQLIDSYRVRGFDAGDAIKRISGLREDASAAFNAGNPDLAKANRAIADALENSIELNLDHMGGDGKAMLSQFRDARKQMAKQYVIRDAIVEGSGSIDPSKLRKNIGNGQRLDGDLSTIANFANTFPKISHYDSNAASAFPWADRISLAGVIPSFMHNPAMAAIPLAIPVARAGGRNAMLMSPAQGALANHLDPDLLAAFMKKRNAFNAVPTALTQSGLYGD